MRERTAPGGVWVIETWDRESVVARLLGRRWHEINPPSVLHWFSRRSLDALLASLGFERVARGRPRKTIGADHVRALLGAHRSSARSRAFCRAAPSCRTRATTSSGRRTGCVMDDAAADA